MLVDEAQDTSPAQWGIVAQLTEEFFAGEGARARPRTLFVVGDEKQSIYSFQGADLANFRACASCCGHGLPRRPAAAEALLDRSFRSAPAVLEGGRRGVRPARGAGGRAAARRRPLHHDAQRADLPGLVELWPLAVPAAAGDAASEPWPLPDAPRTARTSRSAASADGDRRPIRAGSTAARSLASTGERVRAGRRHDPGQPPRHHSGAHWSARSSRRACRSPEPTAWRWPSTCRSAT